MHRQLLLGLGLSVSLAATAFADDWTVNKIRGGVFVLDAGQWEQLLRGSVVSDDRVIKSAPGGRATLTRGAESVEVGPSTTIQIADAHGFTTVYNHEGVVGIAAEVKNVQHFAVQTQYLAAVVKGTAFVVKTDSAGTKVAVTRGHVEVDDSHQGGTVTIDAGQQIASGGTTLTAAAITPISSDMPAPPPAPMPTPQTVSPSTPVAQAQAGVTSNAAASVTTASSPSVTASGSPGKNTASVPAPNSGNGNGPAGGPGKGPGNGNGPGNSPGPGNDKGPGNAHGPDGPANGPGKGPGNDDGPGKGNGPGNGKPENDKGPGNGRGNGPNHEDGPGNSGGPGNGRGNGRG